jgi:hypothetical protein
MPDSQEPFSLTVTLGTATFAASGRPELVKEAFDDFKQLLKQRAESATRDTDTGDSSGARPTKRAPTAHSAHDHADGPALPLPAFLRTLTLPGNKEVSAAIVAWSDKYGEQKILSAAEIGTLWKTTARKPPSSAPNLVRDVRAAAKQGWIHTTGSGSSLKFNATGFTHETVDGWKAIAKG